MASKPRQGFPHELLEELREPSRERYEISALEDVDEIQKERERKREREQCLCTHVATDRSRTGQER